MILSGLECSSLPSLYSSSFPLVIMVNNPVRLIRIPKWACGVAVLTLSAIEELLSWHRLLFYKPLASVMASLVAQW